MPIKLSIDEFVYNSNIVHNFKYDYTKSTYINLNTKLEINCPHHGIFFQIPRNHLRGAGCKKCGINFRSNNRASNTSNFINKAIQIYGAKYDYSKFIYNRSFTKGIVICKQHGEFSVIPNNHLRGSECPLCYGTFKKTIADFVINARKIHGNRYFYDKVIYDGNKKKVIITCPIHGDFLQKPNCHLDGDGCPKCNLSRGESKIMMWLDDNNINYIQQKTYDDCRNPKSGLMLKFDFFIPSKNLLIEYDGEQHSNAGVMMGKYIVSDDDLKNIQFRDSIKTKYAHKNNIRLLRINYSQFNIIDKLLRIELKT